MKKTWWVGCLQKDPSFPSTRISKNNMTGIDATVCATTTSSEEVLVGFVVHDTIPINEISGGPLGSLETSAPKNIFFTPVGVGGGVGYLAMSLPA